MIRCAVVTLAAVCAGAQISPVGTETVEVKGWVGCHEARCKAVQVTRSAIFCVDSEADWLAVTEVYPDTPEPTRCRYDVFIDGELVGRREHVSTGFGPVTWFAAARRGRVSHVRIVNRAPDHGAAPMIAGVRAVRRENLDSLLKADSFVIAGLAPWVGAYDADNLVRVLASNLRERPALGIRRGFSFEIGYAKHSPEEVRDQVRQCERWSREHAMPALLGLVSWWSGTPIHVPDGLGGKFGDVTYQQICYSPEVASPEDERLRELLGDRYTRGYGLSVPNQWSNCPWLTMNSTRLNEYRFARMAEAVEILAELGGSQWLNGLYLENEPRYWDTQCEAGNPKAGRQGKTLWADFNPVVVEAAGRDGVDLDPTDGLCYEELAWLHRNVGRYNQDTVDAALAALARSGFTPAPPVYTHSLQHRDMFPGGDINHPASEWACAKGARTGLEGLWSQPLDFERVREWGRWANVNREENDGRPIEEHLWDLRVTYMMGADLYNSYNWHAIGPRRFFDYVDEFLAEFPVVRLAPEQVSRRDTHTLGIRTPMKLQAFDRVELPIAARDRASGSICLQAVDANGRIIGWTRTRVALTPGTHCVAFEFAQPVESPSGSETTLQILTAEPRTSDSAELPVALAADLGSVKLSLDLRTQRALSLDVIRSAD